MPFDPNEEVITTQGDLKKLIITACELRETELQKQITELVEVLEDTVHNSSEQQAIRAMALVNKYKQGG